MTKEYTPEEIKNRLSNIGEAIGNIALEYITNLEKENAELKEAIKHFNPCGEWNDDVHDCEFRHYAMEYGSKLTKAKELLELFVQWNYGCCKEPDYKDIVKQAEQFIK